MQKNHQFYKMKRRRANQKRNQFFNNIKLNLKYNHSAE